MTPVATAPGSDKNTAGSHTHQIFIIGGRRLRNVEILRRPRLSIGAGERRTQAFICEKSMPLSRRSPVHACASAKCLLPLCRLFGPCRAASPRQLVR